MGDLFSIKKNQQTTQNQQVGVSGSGIGLSGSIGGSQAAANATATGNISAGGTGSAINIVTSDLAALQANRDIALEATNAAVQTSIHALDVLQTSQQHAAELIQQVQAGANDVALKATPVSAGDIATATTAALKPVLIVALIGAGILFLTTKTK